MQQWLVFQQRYNGFCVYFRPRCCWFESLHVCLPTPDPDREVNLLLNPTENVSPEGCTESSDGPCHLQSSGMRKPQAPASPSWCSAQGLIVSGHRSHAGRSWVGGERHLGANKHDKHAHKYKISIQRWFSSPVLLLSSWASSDLEVESWEFFFHSSPICCWWMVSFSEWGPGLPG